MTSGRRSMVVVVAVALAVLLAWAAAPPARAGVNAAEDVHHFGDAGLFGSTAPLALNASLVGMAATPSGRGYWLLGRDGGVFSYGDAAFHGSTGNLRLRQPVVGLGADPRGRGYWAVAGDGGVFSFDVPFLGSMGATALAQPVVGMAPTGSGAGYWLVARDGGIFTFGDAGFAGSTGGVRLAQPIVGMAADPDGAGYWLVAADGGVFAFDADFLGSAVGLLPAGARAVGMAADPAGGGYWVATDHGGVYSFGSVPFHGAGGDGRPALAIVATPTGGGYWLAVEHRPGSLTTASRLRFDGIGPVRVGMTLDEASRAAGRPIRLDPSSGAEPEVCGFAFQDGGPRSIAFMVYDGRVQRVDVIDDPAVQTESGLHIGSRESDVRAAHPSVTSEAHPYDPTGRYLVVDEAGPYKMIFETGGDGRVHSFRSGIDEAVNAIEGCA